MSAEHGLGEDEILNLGTVEQSREEILAQIQDLEKQLENPTLNQDQIRAIKTDLKTFRESYAGFPRK